MIERAELCRACGSDRLFDVFHWSDVPTNSSLFFRSEYEARQHPRGSLRLVGCRACGFVFNADAKEHLVEYSERSMETQEWSARFRAFGDALATRWAETWDLGGKTTLEIGCGRTAAFLELMCERTGGRGIGVDPVVEPNPGTALRLLPMRFDATFPQLHVDAVVCRHTLEHVVDVASFMRDLGEWSGSSRGVVFLFEVPDAGRIFAQASFWDVYYEHTSYFTPCSLESTFALYGFEVERVSTVYDDQYLVLEATTGSAPSADDRRRSDCGEAVHALATSFARTVEIRVSRARARLEALAADGPVVLWQAGAKATGLLTATASAAFVTALVDANPEKHGTFLVGDGLPVDAPEALPRIAPAHVILMNEIYRDEVASALSALGVDTAFHVADDLFGE